MQGEIHAECPEESMEKMRLGSQTLSRHFPFFGKAMQATHGQKKMR